MLQKLIKTHKKLIQSKETSVDCFGIFKIYHNGAHYVFLINSFAAKWWSQALFPPWDIGENYWSIPFHRLLFRSFKKKGTLIDNITEKNIRLNLSKFFFFFVTFDFLCGFYAIFFLFLIIFYFSNVILCFCLRFLCKAYMNFWLIYLSSCWVCGQRDVGETKVMIKLFKLWWVVTENLWRIFWPIYISFQN